MLVWPATYSTADPVMVRAAPAKAEHVDGQRHFIIPRRGPGFADIQTF